MSSHRKLPVLLWLRKSTGTSTTRNTNLLAALALVLCSRAFATECVTPESHARRYFTADLVVFGEVVACTYREVSTKDIPGDSGWVYHHTTRVTEAKVKVDSLLKGSLGDSTIVFHEESSHTSRSRFETVTRSGDSLYLAEIMLEPDDYFGLKMPCSGKWIMFATEKKGTSTFLWSTQYEKIALDLYRIFEDEGEEVFEKYDLSGWSGTLKDSVRELRLIRKVPGD